MHAPIFEFSSPIIFGALHLLTSVPTGISDYVAGYLIARRNRDSEMGDKLQLTRSSDAPLRPQATQNGKQDSTFICWLGFQKPITTKTSYVSLLQA
jgi:hypothetical protein